MRSDAVLVVVVVVDEVDAVVVVDEVTAVDTAGLSSTAISFKRTSKLSSVYSS